MLKRRMMLAVVTLALGAGLVGCSAKLPTEVPGIQGTISSLTPGTGGVSMLVEGGEQPAGAVADRAQVSVSSETPIFDASGQADSLESLRVGAQVKVWFEGPVAESYPVQGSASVVQVVQPAP